MELIDPIAYYNWKYKNQDPYGAAIFRYVELWATSMENLLAQGKPLKEIAKPTSEFADIEDITLNMYCCAVGILNLCWVYGPELREWHNTLHQLHSEGDEATKNGAILNIALLRVGH